MENMSSNLNAAVQVAEKIADGDLTVRITPLSDKDILGKSLLKMVTTIKSIVKDINSLTDAALDGRLDVRGDADKFGGEYARIIHGVNATLEAVVIPLKATGEYVDRIANGNIPKPVDEEYKGDFNEIRNNLNTMIQNLAKFAFDTQEACGIKEVNQSIQQLDQVIQQNSSSTEQMAASCREFSSRSEQLLKIASFFTISEEMLRQLRETREGNTAVPFQNILSGMDEYDVDELITYIKSIAGKKTEIGPAKADKHELPEDAGKTNDYRDEKKSLPIEKNKNIDLLSKEDTDDSEFEAF